MGWATPAANSDIGLQWPEALLKMVGRNCESAAFGPFRVAAGDELWRNGRPVALSPRAIGVLSALLASPGAVVSKQVVLDWFSELGARVAARVPMPRAGRGAGPG